MRMTAIYSSNPSQVGGTVWEGVGKANLLENSVLLLLNFEFQQIHAIFWGSTTMNPQLLKPWAKLDNFFYKFLGSWYFITALEIIIKTVINLNILLNL